MEFKSKQIELEKGIVGIFQKPVEDAQVPAVLMLHGFASHKDEVGDLFKDLAERLALNAIASLRIDFRGWGESAGNMADTTIETLREEAHTALKFLEQHKQIDPKGIGLLGFSLGGAIAILTASEQLQSIKTLATWSSAGDLEKDFRRNLGDAAFKKAQTEGEVEIDLGWRKVQLKQTFFESLGRYKPLTSIQNYPGAFFNIAGSQDFSAEYINAYYENAVGKPKDQLLIQDADHIFHVMEKDSPYAEQVLQTTREWFANTL